MEISLPVLKALPEAAKQLHEDECCEHYSRVLSIGVAIATAPAGVANGTGVDFNGKRLVVVEVANAFFSNDISFRIEDRQTHKEPSRRTRESCSLDFAEG